MFGIYEVHGAERPNTLFQTFTTFEAAEAYANNVMRAAYYERDPFVDGCADFITVIGEQFVIEPVKA